MADTYKFKTPSDLELLEEVPETANAIVEVDGAMKRVPGSNLGGGDSVPTAIFKLNFDTGEASSLSLFNSGVAVASETEDKARASSATIYTATCENMTYEECKALLLAGELVRFWLSVSYARDSENELYANAMGVSSGYVNISGVSALGAMFVSKLFSDTTQIFYWLPDGTITTDMDAIAG